MNENKELTDRIAQMADEAQPDQEISQEETGQQQLADQQLAQDDQNVNEDGSGQTISNQPIQPPQKQKESGHFKKLRESLERAEREKEQLYELLLQQKTQQLQSQKPEEPQLDPHDFVPRAYVDKQLRETKEQVAQYQQALYDQFTANQLRSQYNDFDRVLTKENVARLREEHPEIAASLASNPDMASKAHATYKILTKLGLGQEQNYEPIKQKIQANSQKPRPASASPLAYANSYDYQRMTEDEMQREREAMERDIRG